MLRPRMALIAVVLGTALSASIIRAQQLRAPSAPPLLGDPPAIDPARGARHLLRNGLDYLKTYKDYARALNYLREADARRGELGEAEQKTLAAAIQQAEQAQRAEGPQVAATSRRGRRADPTAVRLARTPATTAVAGDDREAIRLVGGGAVAAGANPVPTADDGPAPLPPLPSDEPTPADPPAPLGAPAPADATGPEPAPIPIPEAAPVPLPEPAPAPPEPAPSAEPLSAPPPLVEAPPSPSPAPVEVEVVAPPTRPAAADPLPPLPADEPTPTVVERPRPAAAPVPAPAVEQPVPAPAPAAVSVALRDPSVLEPPSPGGREVGRSLPDDLRRDLDRIAMLQEEERRQRPTPGNLGPATPTDLDPGNRLDVPRPPSPTEARPIRAIPVPEEFVPLEKRQWAPTRKYWAAAATCHGPLYFQDAVLERYGQSAETALGPIGRFLSYPLDDPTQSNARNQILQPFVSIGLFASQIALWPYNLFVDPPGEGEYDLGYYRPGDHVPPDTYYLPLHGVGPPLRGRRY